MSIFKILTLIIFGIFVSATHIPSFRRFLKRFPNRIWECEIIGLLLISALMALVIVHLMI